jgi:SAM-dependent methyltransferase
MPTDATSTRRRRNGGGSRLRRSVSSGSNTHLTVCHSTTSDIVLSTSVLEHARNPDEYLREIFRVLKLGGVAMHLLPGKWYLPYGPHFLVPLANYFYPNCPTWWLALWTLLGFRHPEHKGLRWREAVKACRDFYDNGVFDLSMRGHERLSRAVFGNCEWPMTFYITHAHGGFARVFRRLPLRKLWGILSREFRMAFLVQRKLSAPEMRRGADWTIAAVTGRAATRRGPSTPFAAAG